MKKKYSSRKWHNWVGIAICIPTIIVGITAILISFEDSYKYTDREPQINVSWIPAYSSMQVESQVDKKINRIRASYTQDRSKRFYGTSYGLFLASDSIVKTFSDLYGVEINCLIRKDSTLLIGSEKGLYSLKLDGENLVLLFKKDIHSIELVNDSLICISDSRKLYYTLDNGKTWLIDSAFKKLAIIKPAGNKKSKAKLIPLHTLIKDIHTGKAIFGKTFEPIWIMLVGFGFTLLGFTGFYMWYDKKRKKAKRLK